ncbi:polyprenol dehydrogenase isoform X2 [Polyergus mexicanus]|uniref:polyprenol dehydrogenase isoform X2 n=1 Tax=Polyergus mexicanus TaxID=615972 RepID=UPI0038B45AD0
MQLESSDVEYLDEKMLLYTIVICVLIVLGVYFVSRKMWYVIGMTLIYEIRYYYIGFVYHVDDLLNARYNKTDLPLVPNKIAIVTGGSKGIGAEVVKKLLQCNMEVIIACRTTTAGEKLILEIRKSGITNGRAKVYKLDNCSLESLALCLSHTEKRKTVSKSNGRSIFFTQAAYGQSKLAQTMFTMTLQKLLTDKSLNMLVYSVHPGIVKTDLFKDTVLGRKKWLMMAWKTPEQGAISIIYAALSKDIERKGGIYISNCKEAALPTLALEEQIRKQLFELSLKQVRLNNFFQHL